LNINRSPGRYSRAGSLERAMEVVFSGGKIQWQQRRNAAPEEDAATNT
jgi:hypothetical protein